MEKSIETIWKEGFLESDALVAPKLNDLYNQKSIHIVDKFKITVFYTAPTAIRALMRLGDQWVEKYYHPISRNWLNGHLFCS